MSRYDTETITHPDHPGFVLQVQHHDADCGAPWEEHDGHGPVRVERGARYRSQWTHGTGKRAGEVELHYSNGTSWFYDVQAATKQAREDGWGLSAEDGLDARLKVLRARHTLDERQRMTYSEMALQASQIALTRGQRAAEAVRRDMAYLQGWMRGDWHWCGLSARVVSAPPEFAHLVADESEEDNCDFAIWGLNSGDRAHLKQVALELGDDAARDMKCRLQQEQEQESQDQRLAEVTRTRECIKPVSVQELGVFLDVPDSAVVRADGWVQAWVFAPPVVELNEEK